MGWFDLPSQKPKFEKVPKVTLPVGTASRETVQLTKFLKTVCISTLPWL